MLVYLVASGAVIILVMLYRRDRRRIKTRRAHFFDACLDLFQSYRVTQEGPNFPALRGTYRGHVVRLDPVIDNMAWRRLPVLWLRVTVLKPNPYGGVLDLLIRPGAVEVFSPSAELDHHLPLPDGWPEQALLCTDQPSLAPPLDVLHPHMALFSDPYIKELLVTPRGVSLVRMIWQASRSHYLVFREIRFEGRHLDPAIARILLDAAIEISNSLSSSPPVALAA
ncbi:MAG TPA: hypothetical protein VG758_21555 [Hyphomicrobiaceae bacterium]|jgi:hypothetical protein|nr:hypothetical protein [Hyphomicrobiaceae bacterium]